MKQFFPFHELPPNAVDQQMLKIWVPASYLLCAFRTIRDLSGADDNRSLAASF